MIAIVGAGAAGWAAAETVRELGHKGTISVFGAEPVVPYERPALSKGFLTELATRNPPALAATSAAELDIRLELNTTIVSVDPPSRTLATADGRQIGYSRLLLATGADGRRLEIPGSELAGIHYLRELREARGLRSELRPDRRIVVVGGGVVGLEVAGSALARGCDVTVIEVATQLMGRVVPAELAGAIEDFHRARDATVRTATRAVAFEAAGQRVARVVLDNGEVVRADAVVVGVGSVPRTALAASAGLAVDDGVLVDHQFRSSDEHIWAAGDAARVFHAGVHRHIRLEQWRPAQEQGRHAAASMLGLGKPYRDIPWMWSDQQGLHVQVSGLGFDGAEIVRRGNIGQREGLICLGVRGERLVAIGGVCIGTGIAKSIKPGQTLIEREVPLDVEALRDPGLDLRRLARRSAKGECEQAMGAL